MARRKSRRIRAEHGTDVQNPTVAPAPAPEPEREAILSACASSGSRAFGIFAILAQVPTLGDPGPDPREGRVLARRVSLAAEDGAPPDGFKSREPETGKVYRRGNARERQNYVYLGGSGKAGRKVRLRNYKSPGAS